MERAFDNFSFQEVVHQVQLAGYGVLCHILFDFAWHGLIVATVCFTLGLLLSTAKARLSTSFMRVARCLALACCGFALPGAINWLITHNFPPVGVYSLNSFNSLGYFCLWSLISSHMLGEETNYQWWVKTKSETAQTSLGEITEEELAELLALEKSQKSEKTEKTEKITSA